MSKSNLKGNCPVLFYCTGTITTAFGFLIYFKFYHIIKYSFLLCFWARNGPLFTNYLIPGTDFSKIFWAIINFRNEAHSSPIFLNPVCWHGENKQRPYFLLWYLSFPITFACEKIKLHNAYSLCMHCVWIGYLYTF